MKRLIINCRAAGLKWAAILASVALPGIARGAAASVEIVNFSFQPASLTVNVGDTVTWTQNDSTQHTSTSDSGVWNSPLLSLNQTFSQTFSNSGSFPQGRRI